MRWFDRDFDYIGEFVEKWNSRVKGTKRAFIVVAVILVLVGVTCVLFPIGTFAAMQVLAAAALVAQGIHFIVSYASETFYFKDPMKIVTGILNILLGLFLLFSPVMLTAASLTWMLALVLIFSGAEKIAFAGKMKYYRIMNTGIMTFCGVLNIILAVIFLVLPLVSMLALHYIVAAYLIVNGVALFAEALSMKQITPRC